MGFRAARRRSDAAEQRFERVDRFLITGASYQAPGGDFPRGRLELAACKTLGIPREQGTSPLGQGGAAKPRKTRRLN